MHQLPLSLTSAFFSRATPSFREGFVTKAEGEWALGGSWEDLHGEGCELPPKVSNEIRTSESLPQPSPSPCRLPRPGKGSSAPSGLQHPVGQGGAGRGAWVPSDRPRGVLAPLSHAVWLWARLLTSLSCHFPLSSCCTGGWEGHRR